MKHRKLIIKLILFAVVLACAGPFILKDRDGRPLLTVDKIKLPHISLPDFDLKALFPKKTPKPVETEKLSPDSIVPEEGQEVETFYTFKDEKGVTHFTNQKPNQDDYKIIYLPKSKEENPGKIDKIKNKLSSLTEKKEGGSPAKDSGKSGFKLSLPGPYSNVGKTIEDAKSLKDQVEDTYKERDRMMNQ